MSEVDRSESLLTQRAEGLLEQIAEQALDDDYYVVRPDSPTRVDRLLTGVATACFALMVTVAAVQTQLDRPSSDRQRAALAEDVQVRQDVQSQRKATVNGLTKEVAKLSAEADQTDPALAALLARTAGSDVSGPGLQITLAPAANDGGPGDVSDRDLQTLANGLWSMGAEAISINGQRLGTLSSIRVAGQSITVNYRSIEPPYVIAAIGNPDRLKDRMNDGQLGQYWQTRADRTGIGFNVKTKDYLQLKKINEARLKLSHATVLEEGSEQ